MKIKFAIYRVIWVSDENSGVKWWKVVQEIYAVNQLWLKGQFNLRLLFCGKDTIYSLPTSFRQ